MKLRNIIFLIVPFVVFGCSSSDNLNSSEDSPKPTPITQSGEVVIEMTSDGYIPDEIKITKGTKVTFKNSDTFYHWPASDLHPSHNQYSDFDPRKTIEPGQSWSFVFDKVGEWGMHDHISPYMLGKITVVE